MSLTQSKPRLHTDWKLEGDFTLCYRQHSQQVGIVWLPVLPSCLPELHSPLCTPAVPNAYQMALPDAPPMLQHGKCKPHRPVPRFRMLTPLAAMLYLFWAAFYFFPAFSPPNGFHLKGEKPVCRVDCVARFCLLAFPFLVCLRCLCFPVLIQDNLFSA